jgi:CRP/FNR family transcriptional regulator, cyclic AMP receptor protein
MAQQNGREQRFQSVDGRGPRQTSSSVSVLEVEPELGAHLAGEQLEQAGSFALPVKTVTRGTNAAEALKETDAFGAIVLDGLLLHGTQIDKRPALRLVEPGDVVPFTRNTQAIPLATVTLRAAARSRLVLLDRHFLVATQRWPLLTALMYRRAVDSSERLATQLAISQLSRVEERLMALMWLLAETWGHVTTSGIRLQLALTHEALGGLVGAQRPTVTLALKDLSERGSLVRHEKDWLILDPPPEPRAAERRPLPLLDAPPPRPPLPESEPPDGRLAELRAELSRLRQTYGPDRAHAQALQDEARELRARTHELVFAAHLLSDASDEGLGATRS